MPVAPVAIHVDHHVAPKLLTKIECQIAHKFHGQRIVAVHMENRRLDHLGDVGAIHR